MNGSALIGLLVGLAVLGGLFAGLERVFRAVPGPGWWQRADVRTDVAYWFFTPLVSRAATRVAVGATLLALVWASGGSVDTVREAFASGRIPELGIPATRGWIRALPFAAQLLLGLLVSDLLGYAVHRAFHRRPLWGLHAVHHGSPRLDWLSSVRLHPINQALNRVATAVPILWLGFDPAVFAVVAPFFTLYAIGLHANVPWRFGPLRFVVASPAFHRWHHTSADEGRDKNFAGLFPLWDLLFGSFYMPSGSQAEHFGAGDEPVPAGLWRQLAYPFRRPRPGERLAAEVV